MSDRAGGRVGGVLLLALLSLSLAGCTREKKEPERRPIRFAVIAAPEIGADDGDLALAVTALSLVKDLAFVLVPGPLLAGDADEVSLELLKNDLGQIAAPVYVALSTTAAVPSESPAAKAGKLTSAKVFLALESMGPGASHAVSYYGQPEAAPGVVVNALGPDGTGAVSPVPAGTTRLVQLIAGEGDIPNALGLEADVLVARAPPGEETASSGYTLAYRKTVKESDRKFPGDAVLLRVAPLSKTTPRHVLVATLGPTHLEIELMPLEGSGKIGPAPGGPPASLLLPPPRNAKPRE